MEDVNDHDEFNKSTANEGKSSDSSSDDSSLSSDSSDDEGLL